MAQFGFVKQKTERSVCLIKTGAKWFEVMPFPAEADGEQPAKIPDYWIGKMEKYASNLLEVEVNNFKSKRRKESDHSYITTVLRSGAISDKISAHTVLLQDAPVPNLQSLEALIAMISLKSRRPCFLALEAIKELLANYLLPHERKLLRFHDCPFHLMHDVSGGQPDIRDKILLLWMFEHKLKELCKKFLDAVEQISKDSIEKTRAKAMSVFTDLLINSPENEQELLSRLVNKLGDPVRSIAAKAMHQLSKVLEAHPVMKMVIVKEVERILYRPNVSVKAQYYAICFLSQILFDSDEQDLANRMVRIYFSFFKASVKKSEVDTKLMAALLTGVNRAFPFAKMDAHSLEEQIKIGYRLVQTCSFNVSVQTMTLLYQTVDFDDPKKADRFFSSLYKKLIRVEEIAESSKPAIFLNLLFKAMKRDEVKSRVLAFVRRLLQCCLYFRPPLVCAVLFLISEVIRARGDLSGLGPQLRCSPDQSQKSRNFEDDDDDDEHYDDVDVKDEEDAEGDKTDKRHSYSSTNHNSGDVLRDTKPSWVHRENLKCRKPGVSTSYDPFSRNPSYSGADRSVFFELASLKSHFHPTVAIFASSLADGQAIKYTGDPLQDFSLLRFLDRFVFRNPKKDPLKGKPTSVLSRRKLYVPRGVKGVAPDSREYANLEESAIPKDELFIFNYMRLRQAKKDDEASDVESVTSEDFNAFMDQLGAKEGCEFDEDGLDFSSSMSKRKKGRNVPKGPSDEDDELDSEDSDSGEDDMREIIDDESETVAVDHGDEGDQPDVFDEEGFQVSDDEGETGVDSLRGNSRKRSKYAPPATKKKRARHNDKGLSNLLASAEEFSTLIDEDASRGLDVGGSGAVSTVKDRASTKQLLWEKRRHDGVKGRGQSRRKKAKK